MTAAPQTPATVTPGPAALTRVWQLSFPLDARLSLSAQTLR